MKYKLPRGTRDVVPPETDRWRAVENVFRGIFEGFGYREIRTPIFESTELFVRAVGEQSDIVTKEMYTFTDLGGRSVTLRPENTAGVIRAYLENGMHRLGGVQRVWYMGPMFRYDRPQAGRYRQFHQVGAEAIGGDSPALDAEMIQLVVEAFAEIGFAGVDLRLNSVGSALSRGPYRQVLLEYLEAHAASVGAETMDRYRKNPLRVFDAKDVSDDVKRSLPVISDHLVGDDRDHFAAVQELLGAAGVRFVRDPYLVRGLDYYTRTVFEVYHGPHGAQNALCGGGRYDGLVEECGGPPTPAIGFSAGLERIVDALPAASPLISGSVAAPRYYVACLDEGAAGRALRVAQALRRLGATEVDFSGRSRKKLLQAAEKSGARFAVVVASDCETLVVRDLRSHEETTTAEDRLADAVGDDS